MAMPQTFAGLSSARVGGCRIPQRRQRHGRRRHRPLPRRLRCSQAFDENAADAASQSGISGKEIIYKFYTAYNNGDFDTLTALLDENVSYHDLIYAEPFVGRRSVLAYFKKVRSIVPPDLKFVIEDATGGNSSKVGIKWHVECGDGVVFPFSRGCSFYNLNSKGQILTGRDLVEPALKSGAGTLRLLAAVTPLIRRLGPRADPSNLPPTKSILAWAFFAGYIAYVMLGTQAPGVPAWQTPPEVLADIFHESINLFYINIFLPLIPVPGSHPVSEALFNFVNAWSLMFLPVLATERRSRKVGRKWAWFTGIMFLTNVFFIPFMALREAQGANDEDQNRKGIHSHRLEEDSNDGLTSKISAFIGVFGAIIGLFSIFWAFGARPEFGSVTDRLTYFIYQFQSNRVFFAFVLDILLYYAWQLILLPSSAGSSKLVPFIGLAAFLITPRANNQRNNRSSE